MNWVWSKVKMENCTFDLPSVILPDKAFKRVEFQCSAQRSIDPNAKSVRVTAFVPFDGRLYFTRHSQELSPRRGYSVLPTTRVRSNSKALGEEAVPSPEHPGTARRQSLQPVQ